MLRRNQNQRHEAMVPYRYYDCATMQESRNTGIRYFMPDMVCDNFVTLACVNKTCRRSAESHNTGRHMHDRAAMASECENFDNLHAFTRIANMTRVCKDLTTQQESFPTWCLSNTGITFHHYKYIQFTYKLTPVAWRGRQRPRVSTCYDPDSYASFTLMTFPIHARQFQCDSNNVLLLINMYLCVLYY